MHENNSDPLPELQKTTSINSDSSLEELEPVFDFSEGFVFSRFACGEEAVLTITAEPEFQSIVQGEDGVYSISPDIRYTDVIQDKDFQSLVESVLRG